MMHPDPLLPDPLLPDPMGRQEEALLVKETPERFFAAIGTAGAVYPLLASILWMIGRGHLFFSIDEVAAVAISAGMGAMLAVIGGVPALVLGMAVRATLKLPLDNIRFFAFSAGLLGLFALIPLLLLGDPVGRFPWTRGAAYFVLGPGLITPLAQLAGGWSECRRSGTPPLRGPWQLGIRQLLAVTLFVAVTLTFLKLLEVLTPWLVAWTCVWLAYQWCTLELVLSFLRWRMRVVLEGGREDEEERRG